MTAFINELQQQVLKPTVNVPVSFTPVKPTIGIGTSPIVSPVVSNPKNTATATSTANPSGQGGVPYALLSVNAVQTPVKQQSYVNCNITVTFTKQTDPNFDHVNIWFVGYHGKSTPQLMATGTTAPINFLCDATGETVSVYAQTVSSLGVSASYTFAAHTTVALTGVVGVPPAPTISQTLTATPVGYQFSFNQVVLPTNDEDVIATYRVYRNTSSNSFSGAILFSTIASDPTHQGAVVVQDRTGGGVNYYYFVTSVNTSGLESASVSAQSGAVTSGTADMDTDVSDGTIYFRGIQYQSQSISLANANFEAASTLPIPGWSASNGSTTLSYETSAPYSGSRSLKVTTTIQFSGAFSGQKWAVTPGDTFYVSAALKANSSATADAQLAFYEANGTYTGGITCTSTSSSWTVVANTGTVPANSVYAQMVLSNDAVSGAGNAEFDAVVVQKILDPSVGQVAAKGSVPPQASNGLAYTSTSSSIQWSWTSLAIQRADGTTTNVPNSSVNTTGLSSSTTYYFYPSYSESAAAVTFQNGGSGSTNYAYTASQRNTQGVTAAQGINAFNQVALANGPMSAATTSSGSGGGSGGGSGTCPRSTMLVEERTKGIIPCSELKVGDSLRTLSGWTEVIQAEELPHTFFVRVKVAGRFIQVTPTHPFTGLDDAGEPIEVIRACDLTLAHQLLTRDGADFVEQIELIKEQGSKMRISCSPEHIYFCGESEPYIVAHNMVPMPS